MPSTSDKTASAPARVPSGRRPGRKKTPITEADIDEKIKETYAGLGYPFPITDEFVTTMRHEIIREAHDGISREKVKARIDLELAAVKA